MKPVPLYRRLATLVSAISNCERSGNVAWGDKHKVLLEHLVRENMPNGGGFDNGTKFDIEASTPEKLVFNTSFHHMDDFGGYDGWTEHRVSVKPSLMFGFHLVVSGRNRNEIKDYIYEAFENALHTEVSE
jgi:hypothetical protein